jgi:hypothetical protein
MRCEVRARTREHNRRAQKRKEGGLWIACSRGQSAGARWQSQQMGSTGRAAEQGEAGSGHGRRPCPTKAFRRRMRGSSERGEGGGGEGVLAGVTCCTGHHR